MSGLLCQCSPQKTCAVCLYFGIQSQHAQFMPSTARPAGLGARPVGNAALPPLFPGAVDGQTAVMAPPPPYDGLMNAGLSTNVTGIDLLFRLPSADTGYGGGVQTWSKGSAQDDSMPLNTLAMGQLSVNKDVLPNAATSDGALNYQKQVGYVEQTISYQEQAHAVQYYQPIYPAASAVNAMNFDGIHLGSPGPPRFSCIEEGCGKYFSRQADVQRHVRNVHRKERLPCGYPDCVKTFQRSDQRKNHYLSCHGVVIN